MKNLLSVDRGTTFMKTSEDILFKSTVRPYGSDEIEIMNDEKIIVEFEGGKYVIGEKGKVSTELTKAKSTETQMLVLTAIALSNDYEDEIITNLVLGLPIGRYKQDKEEMKQLFQFGEFNITINDVPKTIQIANVEVFPEGAGAFYSIPEATEGLIIDVGGLSVDVAQFVLGENGQRKLNQHSTTRMGVMPLYRQIANKLSAEHSQTYDEWDVPSILENGLEIDGVKVRELNIDNMVREYVRKIIESIEFQYNLKSTRNVYLTGGAGIWLHKYFKEKIDRIQLVEKSQFANCYGYYNLGEVIFGA